MNDEEVLKKERIEKKTKITNGSNKESFKNYKSISFWSRTSNKRKIMKNTKE